MIRRSSLAAALVLAIAWLAAPRQAAAYPQFQFSSGTTRCGQCHYSPSGGTLITSWGRDESADTISLGGDGAFLWGLFSMPSWLAASVDLRGAALYDNVGGPESPETAFFPMQADAYVRAAYDAYSLNVTIGDRGVVRPPDPSISGRTSDFAARLMSREHYFMWRPSATGAYFRVGRFYAPYGLRLAEHITWIRRYTGYDLYEETYNASYGYVADDWEVHLTAFAGIPRSLPDFLGAIGPVENGGVVYGEKRFNNMAAVGGQGRVGIAADEARYQVGAVGKLWIEKARVLVLGEADLIRQQLSKASAGENQFVSYLGATYIIRGFMGGVAYERYQSDLSVAGTGRNAIDGELSLFPAAHWEINLFLQWQKADTSVGVPSGVLPAANNVGASLALLQLHLYL